MTEFLSEFHNLDARIPEEKLQFLQERTRNNLYALVLRKFLEQERSRGLTKADLAKRIGYNQAQLNRLLGAPGNWTIKTISDLLVGISGEELVNESRHIGGDHARNYDAKTARVEQEKSLIAETGSDARPPRMKSWQDADKTAA